MTQSDRTPLSLLAGLLSADSAASQPAAKQPQAAEWWAQKKRKRTVSCGRCSACCREDCGKCLNCTDKPKFGGQGAHARPPPATPAQIALRERVCAHSLRASERARQSQSSPWPSRAKGCSPPGSPVATRRYPQAVLPRAQVPECLRTTCCPELLQAAKHSQGCATPTAPATKARRPGRAACQGGRDASPRVEGLLERRRVLHASAGRRR